MQVTVLVIDNEPPILRALARALSDAQGWSVVTTDNPATASSLYPHIDVVITDWCLPFGGGERVVCESPKPVIVYSSYEPIPHPYCVRKPAPIAELIAAVKSVLALARVP